MAIDGAHDSGGCAYPYRSAMSERSMPLGAFSISLAVKDLAASRTFYEKLGFEAVFGTFNPGWDAANQPLDEYTDVRELQARLESAGIEFESKADADTTGPASFVIVDPDGNPVLVDQHV